MFRAFAPAALPAALLAMASAAGAQPVVPGHQVLTRTSGDALIVWDATPDVNALASAKPGREKAAARLRSDALRVAAHFVHAVDAHARSLSVKVIYYQTGPPDPRYPTVPFQGTVVYGLLRLPYRDASVDRDHWMTLAPGRPLPRWVVFTQSGALPPMQ
jgi:hypothetical protein